MAAPAPRVNFMRVPNYDQRLRIKQERAARFAFEREASRGRDARVAGEQYRQAGAIAGQAGAMAGQAARGAASGAYQGLSYAAPPTFRFIKDVTSGAMVGSYSAGRALAGFVGSASTAVQMMLAAEAKRRQTLREHQALLAASAEERARIRAEVTGEVEGAYLTQTLRERDLAFTRGQQTERERERIRQENLRQMEAEAAAGQTAGLPIPVVIPPSGAAMGAPAAAPAAAPEPAAAAPPPVAAEPGPPAPAMAVAPPISTARLAALRARLEAASRALDASMGMQQGDEGAANPAM